MDRRYKITLAVFVGVALVLLWSDHKNHLLGALPWLILLACPLLHKFMHGGHGNHNHGRRSDEGDK